MSFDAESRIQKGEVLEIHGLRGVSLRPLTLWKRFSGPDGNALQLDQAAGEGFSGSPVLREGKVVAVVVDEDPVITFAVKAIVARDAVLGWGGRLGNPSPGPVVRTAAQGERPPAAAPVEPCTPGEELRENGIIYVRICPGEFSMGSAPNDPQLYLDEMPAHPVKVSEFWLGKTEVTNLQYRRFRPDRVRDDALPATDISWSEAKAACESFGGRLPTEAEWEYAARAGSRTAWSFGVDEKQLGEHAWCEKNASAKAHAVGTKRANAWGLYDIHGNVNEWVADWFGPYSSAAQSDPNGPATGTQRLVRGGSFFNPPRFLRSAFRLRFDSEYRLSFIGFRCARGLGRRS